MSNFTGFDVTIDLKNGTFPKVPNAVLKVRDITDADPVTGAGAIALSDINADSNGVVASGTLPIAVGRTVRFTWYRANDGRCGALTRVTT